MVLTSASTQLVVPMDEVGNPGSGAEWRPGHSIWLVRSSASWHGCPKSSVGNWLHGMGPGFCTS